MINFSRFSHPTSSLREAHLTLTICLLSIILPSLITCISGCTSKHATDSAPTSADTILSRASHSVFTNPEATVATARRFMAQTADSGVYYRTATLCAIGSLILGQPDSCHILFDGALDYISRNPEDYDTREQVERDRSLYFNLIGQLDSALCHSYAALAAANKGHLHDKAIKNLSVIGEAAEMLGRPIEAAEAYRRAIYLSDSIYPKRLPESHILTGIAATYTSMANFDEADRYLTLNASRLDSLSADQQYFHYSTLGNSLYQREAYSEAIDAFRNAYALAASFSDPYLMAVSEANLGECMLFENQLDSAAHYIELARNHFDSFAAQDVNLTFYMKSLRGDLALRTGDIAQAGLLLQQATNDTAMVIPRYRAMHYDRLTRYNERTGDLRSALTNLRSATFIRDSIRSRQALNYAADLEERYERDTTVLMTRMRIASKEEEVSNLRTNAIVISMLLIIIILAAVLRNAVIRRRANTEALRMKTAMQSLRMENISNRVSSHFIFNVLNGVQTPQSQRITQVANLIRESIELSNKFIVTLGEELDFIGRYVDLERESLSEGFTYTLTVDDETKLSQPIPAMMIQVFVENAIKHGLRGYDGEKYLDIAVTHADRQLCITITNNGHLHSSAPGTGTGIRVVTQTIHMLNNRNRDKIKLTYGLRDNIYRVVITIPDGFSFDSLQRFAMNGPGK